MSQEQSLGEPTTKRDSGTLQCPWIHLHPKGQHAALQEWWCHTKGSGELEATSTLGILVRFVWREQSKGINPVKIQKSFTLEKFLDGWSVQKSGLFWDIPSKMKDKLLHLVPNHWEEDQCFKDTLEFWRQHNNVLTLCSTPLIGSHKILPRNQYKITFSTLRWKHGTIKFFSWTHIVCQAFF